MPNLHYFLSPFYPKLNFEVTKQLIVQYPYAGSARLKLKTCLFCNQIFKLMEVVAPERFI